MHNVELKIIQDYPLKNLSTFKIGGGARYYLEAKTKEDIISAISWANEKKMAFYIIGGLSNVLINDQGINGLVIKMCLDDLVIQNGIMECGAGVGLSRAILAATEQELSGLEWAVGIPGSIGGAIRGNAGAFGYSIGQIVENISLVDSRSHKNINFKYSDCLFSYRHSIFKDKPELIICSISLKLTVGDKHDLAALMKKYLEHRQLTQPKFPSVGCIFKNVEADKIKTDCPQLFEKASSENLIRNGLISTGWILSQLDLGGKNIGGAMISEEHNNFIVNYQNASSEDVIMLISYIKEQVRKAYSIELHEEIECIGY